MTARPLSRRLLSTGVIILCLAGLSLTSSGVRGGLESGGAAILRPLSAGAWWVTDHLSLRKKNDIATERDHLRLEVAALGRRLQSTEDSLAAAQASLHLEQFVASTQLNTEKGKVIAYSPDPGIKSIVINLGKRDNIKVGLAVVSDNGFFLGKIHDVHEATSTVLLVTDGQLLLSARIHNDQQSLGLIRGERGLAVTMDYISKNDRVEVGQTVVTSGTESNIPPGILVGSIASIQTKSDALFQQASVASPVAYTPIREVAVILQ
ncbi:MAG: rod shape-determining protein MreC [Candidatus Kerfeldbacteria bacterium]|nr:rod shape-determining protein MreC [Candidatus Kerfeldbacteria bacterium]